MSDDLKRMCENATAKDRLNFPGIREIYNNDSWIVRKMNSDRTRVYHVTTPEALSAISSGMNLCTSKYYKFANSYLKYGNIFILYVIRRKVSYRIQMFFGKYPYRPDSYSLFEYAIERGSKGTSDLEIFLLSDIKSECGIPNYLSKIMWGITHKPYLREGEEEFDINKPSIMWTENLYFHHFKMLRKQGNNTTTIDLVRNGVTTHRVFLLSGTTIRKVQIVTNKKLQSLIRGQK